MKFANNFVLEFRPVGNSCNLNCNYCYQNKHKIYPAISINALITFIKSTLENSGVKNIRFVFHGGEPLLLGNKFINNCITRLKTECKDILFSFIIHTHGLHHENLLSSFNGCAKLGISLKDDYLNLYNQETLKYFCNNEICCAVQIVADEKLNNNLSLYDNFYYKKSTYKIIPQFSLYKKYIYKNINNYRNILLFAILNNNWLCKSEPLCYLSEGKKLPGCRFNKEQCLIKSDNISTLAIDYNGDIYPCNRFAAIKKYKLSNIDNKIDLLNSINSLRKEFKDFEYGCPFHALINKSAYDPYNIIEHSISEFFHPGLFCYLPPNIGENLKDLVSSQLPL